jgi:hypothetical protein
MNILLTASLDKGIFCNGLQQNIISLARLLKNIGYTPIICVTHSINDSKDKPSDILIIEEKEIQEYLVDIDIILQAGWVIRDSLITQIKEKNPKCRNIHVLYGNSMLADIERCDWNSTVPVSSHKVDEVWISPHYEISFDYFKTYYKTEKILELPYIWSPTYIEQLEKDLNKEGKSCYWSASKENNIGILEPNLNMTKHCLPSIMNIEEFYTSNPNSSLNKIKAYCSTKLTEKKYFKGLMWKLNITKDEKIFFYSRLNITRILSEECNLIMSHQLLNGLNYTYLETLFFNIPLIHNSSYIKDSGYYYPDYNTKSAALRLAEALETHEENIDKYTIKAKETIYRYSPQNPQVKEKYKKLLK